MIAAARPGIRRNAVPGALYDDFTRPNATPATPSPQGYAYTTPFGTTPRISSNHLGGASDDWAAVITSATTAGDFDWTYSFVTGSDRFSQGTDIIDLYFRYQDASNRCFVELTSTTADESAIGAHGIAVYKYIGGVLTKLGEYDQTLYTSPGESHTLRARLIGTTLDIFLDGVSQLTVTLSVLTTATGVGVHQRANDGYGTLLRAT